MSQAVVERIKTELEAKGVNLTGVCGAFEITKRVAWDQRATGLGVLWKGHTSGNDCNGYAGGHVMMPDGTHWDILRGAGDVGGNGPQWNLVVYTAEDPDPAHKPLIGQPFKRPDMYRPAFKDWSDDDVEPTPEPDPDDGEPLPEDVLGLVLGRLQSLEETMASLKLALTQLGDKEYTGKVFGYTITLKPVKQ